MNDTAAPPRGRFTLEPTAQQIDSACFTFRHDFGLLSAQEQQRLRFVAREWWHAVAKELEIPSHHPMVVASARAHEGALPNGAQQSHEEPVYWEWRFRNRNGSGRWFGWYRVDKDEFEKLRISESVLSGSLARDRTSRNPCAPRPLRSRLLPRCLPARSTPQASFFHPPVWVYARLVLRA